MTDDKIKTKKDILGELESISSLLSDNERTNNKQSDGIEEEPPLLTAMADDAIDFDDDDFADSPLLTDALNSVIDAIEGRVDEDDIPTLADSVSSPGEDDLLFDDDSGLNHDSEVFPDEEPAEDDIVSRALKSNLRAVSPPIDKQTLANAADESTASSASEDEQLPELIIDSGELFGEEEPSEEWDSITEASDGSETAEPDENDMSFSAEKDDANTALIEGIPAFGKIKGLASKAESKATKAKPAAANTNQEKSSQAKALQEKTSSNVKPQKPLQTLDPKQIEAVRAKALDLDLPKAEHQPSLFDKQSAPQTSPPTSATNTKLAGQKSSAGARSNSINANNPFLPKHIRDRLHTNRTLQQEIDDSPYSYTATTPSNKQQQAASHTASASAIKSQDEKLVDELVSSYIAKIEPELRDKIRNLIKQEKQSSDK